MPFDMMLNTIVTTCVLVFAQMYTFVRISEFRFDRRKTIYTTFISTACILSVCVTGPIIMNTERDTLWSLVTLTLPAIIYCFIISKYRGVRFFVTYCISDVSIACADLAAYLVGYVWFGVGFTGDMIARVVAIGIWSVLITRLIGKRYRKALELAEKGWGIMFLCLIGMYALMAILSAYPTPIVERHKDVPIAIMVIVMMELTIIVIVRMIYNTLEAKEHQIKEQELKNQLQLTNDHIEMMAYSNDQIRRIRHDMKYHMNVISGLLSQNKYDELQEYMKSYQKDFEGSVFTPSNYTKNYAVNILLEYYAVKARDQAMEVDFEANLPEHVMEDEAHLVTILGNIIQNAYEACLKMSESQKRSLSVRIKYEKNKLIIQCINSSPKVIINKGEVIESTKTNHVGMGMQSVKHIVEVYHGYCNYEYDAEEEQFICTALLQV